jgi:hypothetical protein
MKSYLLVFFAVCLVCCKEDKKTLSAQEIIDKAIEVAGGERYTSSNITFDFRDMKYASENTGSNKILKRMQIREGDTILDVLDGLNFQRYINGNEEVVHDTLASKYSNSVNSVHYFALLPYGLNDRAVSKELLGDAIIKDTDYYKIKVTFDQEGGGDDFDDIYIYWINKETWKPDYLAYEFHVDGGGMRFREAYNERIVNGIRFVDYKNFKPAKATSILSIDSLYSNKELELLSDIKLSNIEVTLGSYN